MKYVILKIQNSKIGLNNKILPIYMMQNYIIEINYQNQFKKNKYTGDTLSKIQLKNILIILLFNYGVTKKLLKKM